MTEDEKAKEEREDTQERKRVCIARAIAVIAAAISGVLVIVLFFLNWALAVAILQPLLALSLSTVLMAGTRALDGPFRLGSRRREALSSSAAASVLVWLGCFGAIDVGFLVADVVDSWEKSRPASVPDVGARFERVVTVSALGVKQTLLVTGCLGCAKSAASPGSSPLRNSQGAGGVDAENGGAKGSLWV